MREAAAKLPDEADELEELPAADEVWTRLTARRMLAADELAEEEVVA